MKQRLGRGFIAGGIVGSILSVIASIFLWCNRLRTIETGSFTVVDSDELRTITVGIENWLPLLLLALFFLAISLFLLAYGFSLIKKK